MRAAAGLKLLWTPDSGLGFRDGAQTWIDREGFKRLITDSTSFPTYVPTGFAGKPALLFTGLTQRLVDPDGNALLPLTGDWSVTGTIIPNSTNTAAWSFFGNAAAAGSLTTVQRRTNGKIGLYFAGTLLAETSSVYAVSTPIHWVCSWEQSASKIVLRINKAQVISVVTGLVNLNSQLVVGATQALPGSGGGTGTQYYGALGVDNTALTATANASRLAALEAYYEARFGGIY